MLAGIVMFGMALSGAYIFNSIHRFNSFMKYMEDKNNWDGYEGEYINSYMSFENFEKSKPWDYDFSKMISWI